MAIEVEKGFVQICTASIICIQAKNINIFLIEKKKACLFTLFEIL